MHQLIDSCLNDAMKSAASITRHHPLYSACFIKDMLGLKELLRQSHVSLSVNYLRNQIKNIDAKRACFNTVLAVMKK